MSKKQIHYHKQLAQKMKEQKKIWEIDKVLNIEANYRKSELEWSFDFEYDLKEVENGKTAGEAKHCFHKKIEKEIQKIGFRITVFSEYDDDYNLIYEYRKFINKQPQVSIRTTEHRYISFLQALNRGLK